MTLLYPIGRLVLLDIECHVSDVYTIQLAPDEAQN